MPEKITIQYFTKCLYQEIWQKMRDFTLTRNQNTADEIWLLEHFPVFTLGHTGDRKDILNPGNIPVIQTDRGGRATYHGPGQLIVYPLIDLQRRKLGVKQFVKILEQAVIQLLIDYNIKANIQANAPGVYVNNAKICSLGLKIRHGCSYHGLALNVNMDLEPFSRINPCGFPNLKVTQLTDFTDNTNLLDIKEKIVKIIREFLFYHCYN